jgi:hypothetical protein
MKGAHEAKDSFSFDIETQNGSKTIVVENPEVAVQNAIKAELTAFRDAIIHDTPARVSEIDGFQAMEVAHQILEKIGRSRINRKED